MGSGGATGLGDVRAAAEVEERVALDGWSEEIAVVAEEGVGGSDLTCASEWELSVRACNDSFPFFVFFFKKPRFGIQDNRNDVGKGAAPDGGLWSLCAFRMGYVSAAVEGNNKDSDQLGAGG